MTSSACRVGPPSQSTARTPRSARRWCITSTTSTLPSWRTTPTLVAVSGGSASLAVKISTSPAPAVNNGASQGSSSPPARITTSGSGERPFDSAQLPLGRVADDAPVVLGAHRPAADHHRVGPRPQPDEHRGVGVRADLAGAAVDRRLAVDGQGEVREDVRAIVRRRLERRERGQLVENRGLGRVGKQPAEGHCLHEPIPLGGSLSSRASWPRRGGS